MSEVRKVVSSKNLKPKLPFSWTAVIFLLLDRFKAAQWVWGAVGLWVLIIWAVIIYLIVKYDYEEVEIFKD